MKSVKWEEGAQERLLQPHTKNNLLIEVNAIDTGLKNRIKMLQLRKAERLDERE
jgi:hypothetical protein